LQTVTRFPHALREIEHCWIPLGDGCRLAARLWIPQIAEQKPVPALLEVNPYGKRSGTRERDEPMHRYFAGHGYAAVRVDLRGTGESEGSLRDEYSEQEQHDCVQVIAWIAAQPWCDGAVGMIGKSWGGFSALQVAALQPPQLKAIIAVCASDDRYADDAHFMGGCLLNENLTWGALLFTLHAQPPDPKLVGEAWRGLWLRRLEKSVFFPEIWLRHQRRDAYWRRGSVCEDYGRIRCPVYLVSGWADGYSNAVPRLLARLSCPRKGMVGPWAHVYPHEGVPGPAIGFLQESLRWWDHWLKGKATEIMKEPLFRAWLQESVPPRDFYKVRPGHWVAERGWPSSRIEMLRFYLGSSGLLRSPPDKREFKIRSPLVSGLAGGSWCAFGLEGEMPGDQRRDDAGSLCFDSMPLQSRLEILGAPRVVLELASDQPLGQIAVRLNDIAADGTSARVSYGLLNLTHRDGHRWPAPLEPGRRYRVEVNLNDIAYAFPPGHRLRLAVSTGYWPIAWPSPLPVTLAVFSGPSFLELPNRTPSRDDKELAPFPEAIAAVGPDQTDLRPGLSRRTVENDPFTGETVYTVATDLAEDESPALWRFDQIDLICGHSIVERFIVRENDPWSARTEILQEIVMCRGTWQTSISTRVLMTCDREFFHLEADLVTREGHEEIFSRSWTRRIRRHYL